MVLQTLTSECRNAFAAINPENDQLVSLCVSGREIMHGGGKPKDMQTPEDGRDWNNSELIAFPVYGPTRGGILYADGEEYGRFSGNHGIMRLLKPTFVRKTGGVSYETWYSYEARAEGPDSLDAEFSLEKTITVVENGLDAKFRVNNHDKRPRRHQFAWHPVFKTGDINAHIVVPDSNQDYLLQEIQDSPGAVVKIEGAHSVRLELLNGDVTVSSADLPDFVLWSKPEERDEAGNIKKMAFKSVAIEPVYSLKGIKHSPRNLDHTNSVLLEPGQSKEYLVTIRVDQ
jgi:galactose mutarotase-like enzyme